MKKAVSLFLALFVVLTLLPVQRVNAVHYGGEQCPRCHGSELKTVLYDDAIHAYFCKNCGYGDRHSFENVKLDTTFPEGEDCIQYYLNCIYSKDVTQDQALAEIHEKMNEWERLPEEEVNDLVERAKRAAEILEFYVEHYWTDDQYSFHDSFESHWGSGTPTCTVAVECQGCHSYYYAPHDYEWVIDEAATCGMPGKKHQKCKNCDATQMLNTVIPATNNHEWEWKIDTQPTCGTQGWKHQECKNCSRTQNLGTKIDPTGQHDWDWVTDKAATCGRPGVQHQKCKNCDAVQALNTDIPATGDHEWEWVTDKAATCGEAGVQHQKCKNCDATQALNTVIPATNKHEWEWVTDEAATCGKAGVQHQKCKKCDATQALNTEIPATNNHEWEWVIKEAATCEDTGVKYQKCKNCPATQAENTVIDALGHNWGEPAFSMTEDGKAVATFKCKTVESHTKTEEAKLTGDPSLDEPEEDKDGKLTYNATVTVGDKVYQGKIEVPIPRAGETGEGGSGSIVTYTYEGDPVTLKKGSNEPVVLRFSRSEFDDFTLEFFKRLVVDDDTTVAEKYYTKEKGSVVITLSSEFLETLSEGQHTFRAEFTDGSADTVLTVKAEEPEAPATGVEDHAVLYSCVAIVSMMSLAAVLVYKKKMIG